jgi:hypothetical protein
MQAHVAVGGASRFSLIAATILRGLAVSAFVLHMAPDACAKRKPHSPVPEPVASRVPDEIVLGAYGDTRTGPFGLGDNERQKVHLAVVRNLLTTTNYDAVLFTGDAVMTNFPVWAGAYWKTFFTRTDLIVRDNNIHLLPSLGNHETYKWLPAFDVRTAEQLKCSLTNTTLGNVGSSVPEAYDVGESAAVLSHDNSTSQVDPGTKAGRRQINSWLIALDTGTARERLDAALNYGQFEGNVQNQFYKGSGEERCSEDAKLFANAYLKRAHYDYLKPYTSAVKRSYYAEVFQAHNFRIKVIALDTNCLDSSAQQDLFSR